MFSPSVVELLHDNLTMLPYNLFTLFNLSQLFQENNNTIPLTSYFTRKLNTFFNGTWGNSSKSEFSGTLSM